MKVEYRITEGDYAKAMQFDTWRRVLRWPSAIILILLILAAWRLNMVALAVGLAVLITMLVYFGVPNGARRMYRRYKAIQEPMTVELADEGLRIGWGGGEVIFAMADDLPMAPEQSVCAHLHHAKAVLRGAEVVGAAGIRHSPSGAAPRRAGRPRAQGKVAIPLFAGSIADLNRKGLHAPCTRLAPWRTQTGAFSLSSPSLRSVSGPGGL
jgi:hypothetical protein